MLEIRQTFARLWPFIKPFKKQLWIIFVSGVVMAALTPLSIQLVNLLYKAFETKDQSLGSWIPFAFPALFLLLGPARYIHTVQSKYISELIVARIRRRLLDQFMHLNLSFHNSFGSGSGGLLSRVLTDTAILQEGLFYFVDLIREPVTAVLILATMVHLNWKLTLFTFITSPVFIIVMRQVRRSLRKYGYMNREAMDDLTSTLKESLDGVRVIQSFNLEEKQLNRFQSNQNRYLDTRHKIITREEAVSPINEFMGALAFMGLSYFAFHEIFAGRSTAGEFTAFIMAAGILQPPIKKIQNAMVKMQQTIIVTERLFDLIESSKRVPQIASPLPFPKNWNRIKFDNVTFSYGAETVLKNVTLEIKRAEVIALVGESGSGKSTFVNLLERFFDPSTGQILIDDTPITNLDLKSLRQNIALVTQDVFLFRDSIANNIQAGDLTKTIAPTDAARMANAANFIEKTPKGYESDVGERGGLLSGGEKQRVSIARAIYKDAPVLILDEATSALDSVSELEVQKGLQQLMQGRTVFVIAHRLSTIFSADRILVMKKGEIVEQGSHQELLSRKGEYFNFFSLQTGVGG